jgi:hypothetical protein
MQPAFFLQDGRKRRSCDARYLRENDNVQPFGGIKTLATLRINRATIDAIAIVRFIHAAFTKPTDGTYSRLEHRTAVVVVGRAA